MNFNVPAIHVPFCYSVSVNTLTVQNCVGGRHAGAESGRVSAKVKPGESKLIVVKPNPNSYQILSSRWRGSFFLRDSAPCLWAEESGKNEYSTKQRQSNTHIPSSASNAALLYCRFM